MTQNGKLKIIPLDVIDRAVEAQAIIHPGALPAYFPVGAYAEAARALAENALEGGGDIEQNIAYMYRVATAREPEPEVKSILVNAYAGNFERYQADRASALQLVSAGESPRNEALDIAELAAYQMVASLILNLDGTITRD